jgi:molybdate transport system substrate-binding protein
MTKVMSSIALTKAWQALKPKFETGARKIELVLGAGGAINKRIAGGESGDVVVSSTPGIERLVKDGKVVAGSNRLLARSGVGVAVKTGAPRPDISTAESLRQTLLSARCVAYSDPAGGGASGIHFVKVLQQLGIAGPVNAKARLGSGALNGEVVARGEADIAIQQIPELMGIPGIDIVGPLPDELQAMTSFSAALLSSSKDPKTAHALIEFLLSRETAAVLKAAGFEVRP